LSARTTPGLNPIPSTEQSAEGKATLSRAVAEILDRLGSSADQWQARLKKLSQGAFFGRWFATSRERLRAVAERLGLKRVPNLSGCPAS
jgi:hypothetical protein